MDQLALLVSFIALLVAGASYNLSRRSAKRAEKLEYSSRKGSLRISLISAKAKLHLARLVLLKEQENTDRSYVEAIKENLSRSENELKFLNDSELLITQMPREMTLAKEDEITTLFSNLEEMSARMATIETWCESVESFLKKIRGSNFSL